MINALIVSNQIDVYAYQLCKELNNKGYQMHITYCESNELEKIPKSIIKHKIPLYKHKFNFKAILELRSIIINNHINVIYCVNQSSLSNALFASLFTKAKVVAYRGTQAKIRKTDPTYYLGILNPRIDHVICATSDIKESLQKHYPKEHLTYNPKPYKTEWVKDAMKNPNPLSWISKDSFIVVCVALTKGRPYKGLNQLIKAMQLVNNHEVHLVHIGDFEESDFSLAKNGRNANQIHLIGKKNDAVHYLPKADVCICPSTRDASPRSLREAMACELACIVTDIPGAKELVIHKKTGLVVLPNSAKSIANAIEKLAKNPKTTKQYGKQGKAYLEQEFSMDNYANKFDKVFKKVCNRM